MIFSDAYTLTTGKTPKRMVGISSRSPSTTEVTVILKGDNGNEFTIRFTSAAGVVPVEYVEVVSTSNQVTGFGTAYVPS